MHSQIRDHSLNFPKKLLCVLHQVHVLNIPVYSIESVELMAKIRWKLAYSEYNAFQNCLRLGRIS